MKFMSCFMCFQTNVQIEPVAMPIEKYKRDGTDIRLEDTVQYIPNVTEGRVIKVYDGDTITIASKIPNDEILYRFQVRLSDIDCPEIKTSNNIEKKYAEDARTFLRRLVLNKHVRLTNVRLEKYGRLIANVYCGDIHVNDVMIKQNFAVKYDGKKKTTFIF